MIDRSLLYLLEDRFLFIGKIQDNSVHKHHAVQIIVGLDGPVMLEFDNMANTCHCAIIAPDTLHNIGDSQVTQLHLLIDNESEVARKLEDRFFHQGDVHIFADPQARKMRGRLNFPENRDMDCREAQHVVGVLLDVLIDQNPKESKKVHDHRIEKALEILNQAQLEKIVTAEIARQVCLSESRFIHLFSTEIGIPFRKYVLWQRLMRAVHEASSGVSLTDAAHNVGFSDSAHLSRTFRNMFGLTLSEIFKNSRFVQVFSCLYP